MERKRKINSKQNREEKKKEKEKKGKKEKIALLANFARSWFKKKSSAHASNFLPSRSVRNRLSY